MKTSLIDLNNYLFEELERLNDDEELLSGDNLEKEIKRSKAITSIANAVVSNANVMLNATKYASEMGLEKNEMPKLLMMDDEK